MTYKSSAPSAVLAKILDQSPPCSFLSLPLVNLVSRVFILQPPKHNLVFTSDLSKLICPEVFVQGGLIINCLLSFDLPKVLGSGVLLRSNDSHLLKEDPVLPFNLSVSI